MSPPLSHHSLAPEGPQGSVTDVGMSGAPLPLLHDLQGEVQQLPLALLPPLDHLQDGDGPAQVAPQLQHLLVRRLVVFTVLERDRERETQRQREREREP